MTRGEFKLAIQHGAKGYFGKVALGVEPDGDTGEVRIDFDNHRAARWRPGAQFGIEYVLEHVPKRKLFPKGLRIHVDCIEGHEVDTTNVVIAYVAAHALLEALAGLSDQPTRRPEFDEGRGRFVFPK